MPPFLRIAVVVLALSALAPLPASAATVPGCTNPADSALNQYCETIPSAAGAQTPRPGLPALAVRLPFRLAKQVASDAGARSRRGLLILPGPAAALHRHNGSSPAISVASTSSVPVWLIVVLIAVALTLGAVATARWRTRHGREPTDRATS